MLNGISQNSGVALELTYNKIKSMFKETECCNIIINSNESNQRNSQS